MYDQNNIFAKIINKDIACDVIYEDEKVLFFKDINPQAKIHILCIPKTDVKNFNEFVLYSDKDFILYFFKKISEITKKLGLDQSGFRLVTNNGKDANQEVPHFHIHILAGENLKGIK